jgi:hypothetical protein
VGSSGESGAGGRPEPGEPGGAAGTPTELEPVIPCAVRVVLQSNCQRCHQDPELNGAPFPLLTWDDTRVEFGAVLVYQAMLEAVDDDFMPPTWLDVNPPVQPLTTVEKQTLLDWLEAGAPPADALVECE